VKTVDHSNRQIGRSSSGLSKHFLYAVFSNIILKNVCSVLDWYNIRKSGFDPDEILAKNSLSLSAVIDMYIVHLLL